MNLFSEKRTANLSSEKGIALLLALMMVGVVSVLGASLIFTSQSETWSSANYRMGSQARYAAEAGIHRTANFLLTPALYTPPDTPALMADYNMNLAPVTPAGNTEGVVFSSNPDVPEHRPASAAAAAAAFAAFATGPVTANNAQVVYTSSAKLLTMHRFQEPYSTNFKTVQAWEITSMGEVQGPRAAKVEVSAIVGQYMIPLFRYAAFATDNGCAALNFGGGATTNSYDSTNMALGFSNSGANVGTNGNLTGIGATTIVNGSLSTPRSGVGTCTSGTVTAASLNNATVTGGLIEMSQEQQYPTPVLPASALWGTTNTMVKAPAASICSFGAYSNAACAVGANGPTLTPVDDPLTTGVDPVLLGDVRVTGGATLTLHTGTYVVNSLTFAGNADIKVFGDGPITVYVDGKDAAGTSWMTAPVDFTGGTITNASLDPQMFNLVYAGPELLSLKGGSAVAALVYAPLAGTKFVGNGDFYGAVISRRVLDTGGADFHYDRNLQRYRNTASSPMLSSFTWKSF